MKKRTLLLTSLLVAGMTMLAACGSSGGAGGSSTNGSGGGSSSGSSDPSQMVIATGGTGGTYYPLGGAMAELIKESTGITTTAEVTGAAAENMRLMKNGDAHIAFVQGDIADYASKGINMFQEDGKIENFQVLGALYNETVQIVAAANSNINSVADLKGKRVSVGAPGSGTEINAQQILEAYGLTFDDLQLQRLSFSDSAKAIQDGQLDAAFQTAGTPTAAITELAATTGVKIIPIDTDKIASLIEKYPFYVETTIPGNTYQTVPDDVTTVSVRALLAVQSNLSEDLVYKATKAIFENVDKLPAKKEEIKVQDALQGVSLPVHPGAKKYYDEQGVQ